MARWSTGNYPLTTWSRLPYNKPKAQPLKLRLRTRTTYYNPFRACTGFDGGFEVVEAIRSLPNCVITGNSKYKRWRSVSNGSLSAARQSCCTHTSGVWRRPCEKPCRVSFAPVDVSWSYWSSKPVGGRAVEGMLIQRLWWEMPQGIDFRTRVQFPPGPLNAICIQIQLFVTIGKKAWRSLENVEYSMFPGLFLVYRKDCLQYSAKVKKEAVWNEQPLD